MITAWILYAMVVGGLLGAGGLALEKVLRTHGRPTRWVWTGTLLLSVAWPLAHWAWQNRAERVEPAAPAPSLAMSSAELAPDVLPLEPVTVQVGPESVLRMLDGPILAAWTLATGVLVLFFLFLFLRTHGLRKRWGRGRVGGQAVLFSDEWGPAVVGFLRPQIVLPEWCRDMDAWAVRVILDHELEHVRAGDLRLMVLTGLLPVLFPWHLPVWWQLARLRTAVEGDCDLRVLGRHPGKTRPYVDLLLDVGQGSPGRRPLAAMLSEPYETLKRRIRIMTMPLPKRPWLKGGALAGIAAVLVVLACVAPGPTDADKEELETPVESPAAQGEEALGEGEAVPTFTPYSVYPAIKNREEVLAALEREFAALREDSPVEGTVRVWFFLDEEGRVQDTRVSASSGHRALDGAALQLASLAEFTPALNRDQRRPVWVSLPIAFASAGLEELEGITGVEPRSPGSQVITAPPEESVPVGGETGSVTGTVRDAATGQPLSYVQVFVGRTGRGSLTDGEGRFLINDVPAGDREVVAYLVGYGEVRKQSWVKPEGATSVDFEVRPTAIPLEPLVVRGR